MWNPPKKMRKVEVDGRRCSVHFKTTNTTPNALRRALMCDVKNYAPDTINIRKNTSCQTDEYIAHRIGLIPFANVTRETVATLSVDDRSATTDDMKGVSAFRPMPIMKLARHQTLDIDVHFREATGADHTRFSHITNVGYSKEEEDQSLTFETINARDPLDYLSEAVNSLIERVDRNVYFVELSYDVQKTSL